MSTAPVSDQDQALPEIPNFDENIQLHIKHFKSSPGKMATLLLDYITLIQMFPEIAFDDYLQRSTVVAGATDENRQFPKTALDYHCPSKGSQWPPKGRIEIMVAYLQMRAYAEHYNEPPLSFDEFLAMQAPTMTYSQPEAASGQPAQNGDASHAPATNGAATTPVPTQVQPVAATTAPPAPVTATQPAAKPKRSRKATAPDQAPHVVVDNFVVYRQPVAEGQPGIVSYAKVEALREVEGRPVADLMTTVGERIAGVALTTLTLMTAEEVQQMSAVQPPVSQLSLPGFPAADGQEPVPQANQLTLWVPKARLMQLHATLQLTTRIDSRQVGDLMERLEQEVSQVGFICLDLINGQTGPYVDAYLIDSQGEILAELPPREQSIIGIYEFKGATLPQPIVLEVKSQE